MGSVLPHISEDGLSEGPIAFETLNIRILEKLPPEVLNETNEETVRTTTLDILLFLSVIGVIDQSELSRGMVFVEINLAEAAGRSVLESLRGGLELMDWRSQNPDPVREGANFLKNLEQKRLESTVKADARPIRSRNVAIGLIKGRCDVIGNDVIFFQLKARTNVYREIVRRWEPLSRQVRPRDFHREMSSMEAMRRISDVEFLPGKETVEYSLEKAFSRTFEPGTGDWEFQSFPSKTFPVTSIRFSETQFQFTKYNYFPFAIDCKLPSDEFHLSTRAGIEYKWLTLDYIRERPKFLDNYEVFTESFHLLDDNLACEWEGKYLKNVSVIRVPYAKVKHINDHVHLCLDLHMRTEANIVYSDLREEKEVSVSDTEKLLLLELRAVRPNVKSFQDLRKILGLKDVPTLQKVKSRLAGKLFEAFGQEYIETHKGSGYSLRDKV